MSVTIKVSDKRDNKNIKVFQSMVSVRQFLEKYNQLGNPDVIIKADTTEANYGIVYKGKQINQWFKTTQDMIEWLEIRTYQKDTKNSYEMVRLNHNREVLLESSIMVYSKPDNKLVHQSHYTNGNNSSMLNYLRYEYDKEVALSSYPPENFIIKAGITRGYSSVKKQDIVKNKHKGIGFLVSNNA